MKRRGALVGIVGRAGARRGRVRRRWQRRRGGGVDQDAAGRGEQHAGRGVEPLHDGHGRRRRRARPSTITGDGVTAGDGKTGQLDVSTARSSASIEERIVDGVDLHEPRRRSRARRRARRQAVGQASTSTQLQQQRRRRSATSPTRRESNCAEAGPRVPRRASRVTSQKLGDDDRQRAARHALPRVDRLREGARRAARRDRRRHATQLAKLGTVPADVWIDDDDRVVKMHMTIDARLALGAAAGTAELTMEITDFGGPSTCRRRPADQTVDFSSLAGVSA